MFFGTPALCVPSLMALHETTELVGVVCQPDRPAGRGMKLTPPAVKLAAEALGVPVYQPTKVRNGELEAWLRARDVDLALVLAYGRILPEGVLAAPRLGCINLHASLLPAYRGAAPIHWSVIQGEAVTGLSLMQMDAGLDTGPVYLRRELSIGPDETSGELTERLAALAQALVREALPQLIRGELSAEPQDASLATYAPPLTKEHQQLDFSLGAQAVHDWIRGLTPQPGARTRLGERGLKIARARVMVGECPSGAPGEVVIADKGGVVVACGQGHLSLVTAQLEGKKAGPATDLVNGRQLKVGDRLG